MSHTPGRINSRQGFVAPDSGGYPLCSLLRDESTLNMERLVACWNACADLTSEQVAAIPRMVQAFRRPIGAPPEPGYLELRELFRKFEPRK